MKDARANDEVDQHQKCNILPAGHPVNMQYANVNGVTIAHSLQGAGPPLVLIMGYRLSSVAWPLRFIEALSKQFTVVLIDNRGTGVSDKPTFGYEISNMARDVNDLLTHLKIDRANILGYSMGGAIAQEFVRQFPNRVLGLVLCATMSGGPHATYASPAVVRVMRELEGLTPEEIARRIWQVTYSPKYLAQYIELAEDQMRREIASPTPLHAADLQYQAFAEFDCSAALSTIQAPTLVLTGDLDRLVSPNNSKLMAGLIPGCKLIVIPGCGHRMMWEATDECVEIITDFLLGARNGSGDHPPSYLRPGDVTRANIFNIFTPAVNFMASWPWIMAGTGTDMMAIARQSFYFGGKIQFGDGKPVILVPELGSAVPLMLMSNWLRSMGYRPVMTRLSVKANDRSIVDLILAITKRTSRRAVIVTSAAGFHLAADIARANNDWVSDIIVLNASRHLDVPLGIRSHFISPSWSLLLGPVKLLQVLRSIPIELIGATDCDHTSMIDRIECQLSAEGELE